MASQQGTLGKFHTLNQHPEAGGLCDRVLATMPGGLVILDASSTKPSIVYCNPAFEKITGYTSAEVIGRDCCFLQGVDTDQDAIEQIRHALHVAQECRVALKNYRKDGTPFWNELIIAPVWDASGKLTQFLVFQTDITKRKLAEQQPQAALQQSETRLGLALNAASMGVWEWEKQTGQLTWSANAESLLGFPPGSFGSTYEAYLKCIHPEECDRVTEAIAQIVEASRTEDLAGRLFSIEHRLLCPDGAVRWVAVTGTLFCDQTHTPTRVAGTVMDITGRKQVETALWQQATGERLLRTMNQRIRQSLNLEEVLKTAVSQVRQFLNTDRVTIYRLHSDGCGVGAVESVGTGWAESLGTQIHSRCFGENHLSLYQQGEIQAIENIDTANLSQCQIDWLAQFQVKASLVVPIVQNKTEVKGLFLSPHTSTSPVPSSTPHSSSNPYSSSNPQLWGLLVAQNCTGTRQWQASEVELLKQLSVQLAIAIQQSTLFEQLEAELVERKQAEEALQKSEAQLRKKTTKLKQALHRLRKTQTQLIQSEKMSSLGQLVAGVAHEINNPVSFIYGNLTPALQYAQDLLHLLNLYQQHYPQPAAEIQTEAEAMDWEFLVEDFPRLLDSMQMGAERIRQIVLSLRNFSRHDESQKKPVDLHEGIDSTLLILQHRLKPQGGKPGILIVKQYGDLPQVECYAGQINQVFMNLLSNAIDALERETVQASWVMSHGEESCDRSFPITPSPLPTIRICTTLNNKNQVVIRIADNGGGIPESVQKRIFDPFFTTKPVGEGTGLGLSISYQVVVERHGGQLKCLSTPGQGTEFILEIPLQQCSESATPLPMAPSQVA
ncbi:PAS domain S-box protein [Coleofasciculus sp. FACHB-1120]|uniref:PAS domain S-box protein n=1 Tax=Coleofasciculus sp. FACHB-1120 TaxID=2692783 RepID=UPI00168605F5|nr:PAS domain S-box protein [Coleofasciculus sp. FACHB-1120]MBD2743445.1 PAS domain-containing protein [Coleofasciculus sp. FACHB-1120]